MPFCCGCWAYRYRSSSSCCCCGIRRIWEALMQSSTIDVDRRAPRRTRIGAGREPGLGGLMGGDHRRRVCDRGNRPDAAGTRRGAGFRLGLAMVQFRRIGDHLYRRRGDLAARRAVAVGGVRRLSNRPAAHKMGLGAQRRNLFPRHRARVFGLGGGRGDHRGGAGLGNLVADRRGGANSRLGRILGGAGSRWCRRRSARFGNPRSERLSGRHDVPHRSSRS